MTVALSKICQKLDIPDRKKTTTTELTMENQWIWTSLMVRYVSHRDAHFTSLSCTEDIRGSAFLPLHVVVSFLIFNYF